MSNYNCETRAYASKSQNYHWLALWASIVWLTAVCRHLSIVCCRL